MRGDLNCYALVGTDIDPEAEQAFNDWYNREHVRDRALRIPGYISGRRYVATEGAPKYLARYRTVNVDLFTSI